MVDSLAKRGYPVVPVDEEVCTMETAVHLIRGWIAAEWHNSWDEKVEVCGNI